MLENNTDISLENNKPVGFHTEQSTEIQKLLWLRANRGVLAQIARLQRKRKYSSEFVRQVFWGVRNHSEIRRALIRRGAPMMRAL